YRPVRTHLSVPTSFRHRNRYQICMNIKSHESSILSHDRLLLYVALGYGFQSTASLTYDLVIGAGHSIMTTGLETGQCVKFGGCVFVLEDGGHRLEIPGGFR
ncbi:MAG TPA: hypothetical protein PKG82_12275, partial [Myxococcota bacterium]|nr:hypothetical protein [Myxococcota bacterium]